MNKEYPAKPPLKNISISIVTPSFNQGPFIRETIESVLNQDYPAFEYFIIDGGSKDETGIIAEEYSGRCHYSSEPDNGQAHAVNKGIKQASGEIIGWLNSDDVYTPGALRRVAKYFEEHPFCNVLYGNANFINREGTVVGLYPTERFKWERLARRCFLSQPSVFFRKSAVEEVGYLNESLQLCMDYELWMRLGKKYDFDYIDEILSCSRIYHDTKTSSRFVEMYEEAIKITKQHYGYIPLSWLKASVFHNNPSYSNVKVIEISILELIRNNYRYPIRIVGELWDAFARLLNGAIRWR